MNLSPTLAAALLGAAALAPTPAFAGPLTVAVSDVKNASGQVRVDVCVKRDFLKDKCSFAGAAPARAGAVTVTVPEVPAGRYAVQVYHDENGDGRMKRGFMGIPQEGFGFSNDIKVGFGPPSFDKAAVQLDGAPRRLAVKMRY
jgi:uncharacterized protein (DUF2141 family)